MRRYPGASANDNAHPVDVANICYNTEREFDGLYDPARLHTPAKPTIGSGYLPTLPFQRA